MIKKYCKKPIVLEAIQWTGDNTDEVLKFGQGKIKYRKFIEEELYVKTLEGELKASKGDYIIKGIKGEFYPCKPDVFEKIYEEVNDVNPPELSKWKVFFYELGDKISEFLEKEGKGISLDEVREQLELIVKCKNYVFTYIVKWGEKEIFRKKVAFKNE